MRTEQYAGLWNEERPRSLMIAAPPWMTSTFISAHLSAEILVPSISENGTPSTVTFEANTAICSPCPPYVEQFFTRLCCTPHSFAMALCRRVESRAARVVTCEGLRPEWRSTTSPVRSAGLKITTTCFTSGQYVFTFFPNSSAIWQLPLRRSSRVIPSLRGAPPEEMMYLASVKASLGSVVHVRFTPSKPQWNISSATPLRPGSYTS